MKKILLVDDDLSTTRFLEILFSKEGYEVLSVNDSQQTLPKALDFYPDIILLDLMMPGVDGIETCKILRANPMFAKTPILFLTALAEIDHKIAAYQAGATGFLAKPVHPTELKLKIKALLGLK